MREFYGVVYAESSSSPFLVVVRHRQNRVSDVISSIDFWSAAVAAATSTLNLWGLGRLGIGAALSGRRLRFGISGLRTAGMKSP